MTERSVILITNAPAKTGIAWYYYLAFKDILGAENVIIIDEGSRVLKATIYQRVIYKVRERTGTQSKLKLKKIVQAVSPKKNNIIIVFNTANLAIEELSELRKLENIWLLHVLTDHPYAFYKDRKQLAFKTFSIYDAVVSFANDLIPVLYQLGAKKVWRLPFAYCKYTHYVNDDFSTLADTDIVAYFGTWSPEIENWIAPLKQFNLQIEGHLWENAIDADLRALGNKPKIQLNRNMATAAREAAVVVNFTRAAHGCFHTMKTFELTAAGACVVSNTSEEQKEFFPVGEGVKYFNTKTEMVQQINFLLSNPAERQKQRINAVEQALPHHYHNRAKHLINCVDELENFSIS